MARPAATTRSPGFLPASSSPPPPRPQENYSGDAQLVNSVYFDNDSLELYHGRLDKKPGAIALRIRWVHVPAVGGCDVHVVGGAGG